MAERARRGVIGAGAGAVVCAVLALPPSAEAGSEGAEAVSRPLVVAHADEPGDAESFGLPAGWSPTVAPSDGFRLPEDLAIGVRFLFTGEFPVERLVPGDEGPAVSYLQRRLDSLGFRAGPVDGNYGPRTSSAVLAFQKYVGIERTGELDATTLAHLRMPMGRGPRSDAPGPRIEIDLARQVLFVVHDDGGWTVVNTSTGNNELYHHPAGYSATAVTPTGSWPVFRRVEGWDPGPLGSLYRPLYFTGGFAVHGSNSVPAYPASHGCARTSPVDQDWIWQVVPNGAQVTIY